MVKLEDVVYCAKCDVKMQLAKIPRYEFEEGCVLRNVDAYLCKKCNKYIFTKEQSQKMERKTNELKIIAQKV